MTNTQKPLVTQLTKAVGFAILVFGLLLTAMISTPKRAAAAPFTCDDTFYQVIFGSLNELDPVTGTYVPIGFTGAFGTNAIGYNPVDNYIYGWRGTTDGVVRIEHDATTTVLGVPAGLPTGPPGYAAGDVDDAGDFYLLRTATELYRIDLSTNTATLITLTGATPPTQEIVFLNGMFYNINGTSLFEINPNTGVVTEKPLPIMSNPAIFGAGWAADNSKLFFARNSDGMIFEISNFTGPSPSATPVLQGQPTDSNDGASCAAGRSPIPPLFATNDTNKTEVDTPVTGNVITNDSGRQITVTDYTQPSNGTVVVNPDGSYTYTPNPGFTGTDTFTYTITDEYGEERTASVTINVLAATTEELADTGLSDGTITLLLATGVTLVSVLLIKAPIHKRYQLR